MPSSRYLKAGILTLAALLTAVTLLAVTDLRIETNLLELLPENTSDMPNLAAIAGDLKSLEKVIIVLTLPDGASPGTDMLDLGCRARELLITSDLFTSVRCGWSEKDEDFFFQQVLPRSILYTDETEMQVLEQALAPSAVTRSLAELRREIEGVTGMISMPFLRADPLGLAPGVIRRALMGSMGDHLVSRSGNRTLIFASLAETDDAAAQGSELSGLLSRAGDLLSAEGRRTVQLEGIGAPFYARFYESSIRREVTATITFSAVAVALLLTSYFGSLRLPIAVVTGVGAAVIWTGGLLALSRGHVSFIALSMGAILVGLGVDYGIHVGHDMQRLLHSGSTQQQALAGALSIHLKAIISSAATTFTGFIVLLLSTFHPLRELGLLIPLGISLVMIGFAMVTVPILLGSKSTAASDMQTHRRLLQRFLQGVVQRAGDHASAVLVLLLLVTVILAAGINKIEFQSDFNLFRPPVPELDRREQLLRHDFSLSSGTTRVLIHADNLDDALLASARFTSALARDDPGATPPLAPTPWLLGKKTIQSRQQQLAAIITPATVERLRQQFLEARLQPDGFDRFFATLDAIAGGHSLPPIATITWPDWLGEVVTHGDGRTTVSIVFSGDGPEVEAEAGKILAGLAPVENTEAMLFSLPRVGRAIKDTLHSELRRLMSWSAIGIILVLLLSFRGHPGWTLLSLLPVTLGIIWLLGLAAWAEIPLNLFTVATFPVLVGIGIDDGLHVAHGAARDGSATRSTGQRAEAMTLTTLTTMIGFGALGFSSMPAIAIGGPLIATGVAICLLLTLTLPPALDRAILQRLRGRQR